ncbi:MAG: hypothetical protein JXL81_13045 [Deltaproteobacteria bacterium]|nr:hypothetical protein [Deltaproteobacteria bacterium]
MLSAFHDIDLVFILAGLVKSGPDVMEFHWRESELLAANRIKEITGRRTVYAGESKLCGVIRHSKNR